MTQREKIKPEMHRLTTLLAGQVGWFGGIDGCRCLNIFALRLSLNFVYIPLHMACGLEIRSVQSSCMLFLSSDLGAVSELDRPLSSKP